MLCSYSASVLHALLVFHWTGVQIVIVYMNVQQCCLTCNYNVNLIVDVTHMQFWCCFTVWCAVCCFCVPVVLDVPHAVVVYT